MNILVLTAYPPVLHMHGGGVRMYHNIRILSSRHRVRVISFVESDEELERLESVRSICESVTAVRRVPDFQPHWLSVLPFMVREFSTPEMYSAVDRAFQTEKVDVLQCEYLQMAQFRRDGVFSVLTIHETLSANAYDSMVRASDPVEKLRLFYRWMQLLRYEVQQTRKFDRVIAMTASDASYLQSYSRSANVRAIPIGIDPQYFIPIAEDPHRPVEVLFVGNFRHFPNVEAAVFLVEQVASRFPDVRFVISGSDVPQEVPRRPNVRFTGYVSETRDLYHGPDTIVIAPLFSGTGQRVKLLEAFAMACPVMTTTVGALGYPIHNGVEAIIANTADEFSHALQSLLSSPDYRRQLGTGARRMILEGFSWDRIAEDLLGVIKEASVSN